MAVSGPVARGELVPPPSLRREDMEPNRRRQPQSILTTDAKPPADTKRVLLIRHGHSHRTDPDRPMDPELTALGRRQAALLKDHYSGDTIELIVSSELRRARGTADAIGERHAAAKRLILPAFNEVHTVGDWRRIKTEDAVRISNEVMYRPDHPCPMGETPRLFHRRVSQGWEEVLAEGASNILIVSHAGVIGVLVSLAFGLTEDHESHCILAYPHAASSELWIADKRSDPAFPDRVTIIRSLCRTDHLPPQMLTI